MKKQKAITLVSVVVTVILLIILATVSITAVLGENGIITIAKQAKENIELAQMEEQTKLNELYTQVDAEAGIGDTNSTDLNELIVKMKDLEAKITNLESNAKTLNDIYPVGSVYISTGISTAEEVATKLGGTWESYGQGKTLVGVGTGTDSNSTEKTFAANEFGGEYNHKLTIEEMPSHTHGLHIWAFNGVPSNYGSKYGMSYQNNTGELGTSHDDIKSQLYYYNDNTGGSLSHNNIQPYITVYMWKRIS